MSEINAMREPLTLTDEEKELLDETLSLRIADLNQSADDLDEQLQFDRSRRMALKAIKLTALKAKLEDTK